MNEDLNTFEQRTSGTRCESCQKYNDRNYYTLHTTSNLVPQSHTCYIRRSTHYEYLQFVVHFVMI